MTNKISIITPSYNQGRFIEECIMSVINQKYDNFEHIVIDGGSEDETISILKKYKHLKWVSERDEGQSDALNKGLKMASGNIIGWINSDDYYLPGTFLSINNVFNKRQNLKWVVSNELSLTNNKEKYIKISEINYHSLIKNPDIVKQQGAFYLQSELEIIGGFDKDLYMVMDFDLWVKLAKRSRPYILDQTTAVFRHHLDQKTSDKNILIQFSEIKKILKREKVPLLNIYIVGGGKYLSFLKKRVKRILILLRIIDSKYLYQNIRN